MQSVDVERRESGCAVKMLEHMNDALMKMAG
jgi:predicted ribosome-associated RNA-binding protein Tma20